MKKFTVFGPHFGRRQTADGSWSFAALRSAECIQRLSLRSIRRSGTRELIADSRLPITSPERSEGLYIERSEMPGLISRLMFDD